MHRARHVAAHRTPGAGVPAAKPRRTLWNSPAARPLHRSGARPGCRTAVALRHRNHARRRATVPQSGPGSRASIGRAWRRVDGLGVELLDAAIGGKTTPTVAKLDSLARE